jgi:hypothetical protein
MISPWRAKHPRVGAEVDPYRETPPLALDPGRTRTALMFPGLLSPFRGSDIRSL